MFGQLPQTGWKRRPPRFKHAKKENMVRTKSKYDSDKEDFSISHCLAKKNVMVNRVLVKWSLLISLFLFINLSTGKLDLEVKYNIIGF